jgi:acetolactate decarboxylase
MVRRRDLLKASLSVSGCGTCGALGIGMSGGSARADGPTATRGTGYELGFIGAQRETIMNGKLAVALDLKTLAGRPHLYGLGPIEQLRGEVMIADSRPALARVGSDGTVNVTGSFDAGVPFFVWAEVPQRIRMPIPEKVRSFEDLESVVPRAAEAAGLDAEKPLPFLVTGREDSIEYHIRNRIGDPPHNMKAHKKIQIVFELARIEATIVGFHSTKHRGIFTPGDSNIHTHFQTPDNDKSGHIQKIEIGSGATLSLPAAGTAASSIEPTRAEDVSAPTLHAWSWPGSNMACVLKGGSNAANMHAPAPSNHRLVHGRRFWSRSCSVRARRRGRA